MLGTVTILYLDEYDTRLACACFDPVRLAEDAYARHRTARVLSVHPVPGGLCVLVDGGADDRTARVICVTSSSHLVGLWSASAVTAIARRLVVRPVVTVGVLGGGGPAALCVELLAGNLPGLTHVALFEPDRARAGEVCERLAAALAEPGVGLTMTRSARDAVRGADLVVPVAGAVESGWLARGAVLVGLAGTGVGPDVVARVDRILVDDWAAAAADPTRVLGRMRAANRLAGVDAELVDVFSGDVPARSRADETVFVELVDVRIVGVHLTTAVYHAANRLGLGVRLSR